MNRLLNLHIDQLSFWFGFIIGIFSWWLISKIGSSRLFFNNISQTLVHLFRQISQSNTDRLYRKATLVHTQMNHITSSLFLLDDIAIKPKILAPPVRLEPGVLPPAEDITYQTIPYTPDWPQLASGFGAPKLTLEEALSGGGNLILQGEMGSGKSTALCQLASDMAPNRTNTD